MEPRVSGKSLGEDRDLLESETFRDDNRTRCAAAPEATMRIDRDLTKTDVKADPPPGLTPEALKQWHYQRYIKDYLRCIPSVDDNMGRFLDFLDREGLRDQTLVLYTSDHGFLLSDHNWYDQRFKHKESIRMPLLVRWPGQILPGTVDSNMVLNVDFAPALLACAGLATPNEMHGRSLLPMLRGQSMPDWRTSWYYRYYHYPQDHRVQPHYGVRSERFKLIYFNKLDCWELYDLRKDPRELNSFVADAAYADTLKQVKAGMTRLRRELGYQDQFADGPPEDFLLPNRAGPKPAKPVEPRPAS